MNEPRNVHLWLPGWNASDGGIQAYSHFFASAMREVLPNAKFTILSKQDRVSPPNNFNGHVRVRSTGRWPGKLRTAAFCVQAYRDICFDSPDLIISTLVNFAPLAQRIAGSRIPYWLVAHGIDVWGRNDPGFVEALLAADRILCVSRYTRDRLATEQQIPAEKLALQPNTFDEHRFRIAPKPKYLLERYKLSAKQPILLTVARLNSSEQYKGYDRVIQSLAEIRRHVPDAHYLIVGRGDDSERVRTLAREHNLADHITLAGFVPDNELPDHYALCDLFIMPSKGEGFGIVFLEALASGKPVLGGNRDGSRDPLMDGELGALVDPDDCNAIASESVAILLKRHSNEILHQPEELRKRVIDNFGFARFKQTLHENLKSLRVMGAA